MNKEKVIIKLDGGLGNQMFQWALARTIQEVADVDVYLDMSYFSKSYARPYQLNIFQFEPNFVQDYEIKFKLNLIWKLRKFLNGMRFMGIKLLSEQGFNFDKNMINKVQPDTYIIGFFQSEQYFNFVKGRIRDDFRFKYLPDEENRRIITNINKTTSVSLHIRRGDYVEKEYYQNLYTPCTLDYYKRAVDYIAQKHPNPTLFVFSDDIRWARLNLKLPYETFFVENNRGKKSYEDLRLMSMCKHNIIANSSFSWWGAWLNNFPEKIVVAPKKWFNDDSIIQTDIIPQEWIKLEN